MPQRLLVIDANSLIHRAYHALPKLTTKKGEAVNAVYGFLRLLFKAIRELKPDFIAAAFDLPQPTFRHEKFTAYKAHRPKTPEDLSSQLPLAKEALASFHIPVFESPGFEADDLIGTIVEQMKGEPSLETIIVSGDLDTLQLINPQTKVFTPKKGLSETVIYDERAVQARFGFSPLLLADFKALRGDPSDNIPGVAGIGETSASFLVKTFGSLEALYGSLEKKDNKSGAIKEAVRKKLTTNKDEAFFSKELALIRRDAPLTLELDKCRWQEYDRKEATAFLEKLDFGSLINRLPSASRAEENNPPGAPERVKTVGGAQTLW